MVGVVEGMHHLLHQLVVVEVASMCHPVNEDNNQIPKLVKMVVVVLGDVVVETVIILLFSFVLSTLEVYPSNISIFFRNCYKQTKTKKFNFIHMFKGD